jgi:electron-transferring-flavoprotein dehydrogenase
MGVEVYPGFAGKEVLYDWHGAVVGVATGEGAGGFDGQLVEPGVLQCGVIYD